MTFDTLIVGGGLSGLYAAHLLQAKGVSFRVLEARQVLGGRILTKFHRGTAIELGASWFWPENNPRVARLVQDFELPSFAQYTDGDALIDDGRRLQRQPHRQVDPRLARRLTNGSRDLIEALLPSLPSEHLLTGHQVKEITQQGDSVSIRALTQDGREITFTASKVIVALPLRLLAETIEFTPALPPSVMASFHGTPTWMAAEAKFIALYETQFWRNDGLSGTALSMAGPLAESHDASYPDGFGALLGFFTLAHEQRTALGADLVPACLKQLGRYFGPEAERPIRTELIDWSSEPFTATAQENALAGHPTYGLPIEAQSPWDAMLRFAGNESAPEHGGYLEGALEAAEHALQPQRHRSSPQQVLP